MIKKTKPQDIISIGPYYRNGKNGKKHIKHHGSFTQPYQRKAASK